MTIKTILVVILLATQGCSTIGDVIVPPHPHSDIRDNDAVCVTFESASEREMAGAFALAPLAKMAIDVAIDQTSKAIAKESKRYKETYSGRASDELFVVAKEISKTDEKGKVTKHVVPGLRLGGFTAKRVFGESIKDNGCSPALMGETVAEPTTAILLTGRFEVSSQGDAIRIVPTSLDMTHSKSKVAAPSTLIPWSWWMYLDGSRGKVDVSLQIDLSMVLDSKAGRKTVTLGTIDIPVGKVRLDDGAHKTARQLSHLASDWVPLPRIDGPNDYVVGETAYGPVNLMVTTIEADDLGDVFAKGAEKLDGNKDALSNNLLNLLGLGSETAKDADDDSTKE